VTIGLIIWAQAITILAGIAIYHIEHNSRRGIESQFVKLMEERARTKPSPPIVVPAPDLTPYLAHLSKMSVDMARELAAGVSLIVQGPPSTAAATVQPEAPAETDDLPNEDVQFPSWESDPSWHLSDPMEHPGDEWSAHTTALNGNGLETVFGSGGTNLGDP
jgi:hypothetical protein